MEEGEDTSHDAGELNSQESSGEPVAPCEANSGIKKQLQEGFVNFKTKTTACDIHQSEEKENYSKKTIGHPDHIINNTKSSEDSSDEEDDEESEEELNDKDYQERDENFVIESDNVHDKLYSSETDDDDNDKKPLKDKTMENKSYQFSANKNQPQNTKPVLTKEGTKELNLSTNSSSTSSEESSESTSPKKKLNAETNVQYHLPSSTAKEYDKKKTFALNLQSESESQGREGIDEFDVSGPENDLAEDDFWN